MVKVNVLSKNGTFLFRFNDGEFGSKWCGLWKDRTKYFDYFAFEVNDEFLSKDNVQNFEFYNTQFERYTFKTKDGLVTEEISCIENGIMVALKSSFDATVKTEIGINIRDRSENYVLSKVYKVESNENRISASIGDKTAYIFFSNGEFKISPYYGVHRPGLYARDNGFSKYFDDGSPQNKFIPGMIKSNIKRNENLILILSNTEFDQETIYKLINNRLKSVKEYGDIINTTASIFNIPGLSNDLIKSVVDALYSYSNSIDKKIYAGFPYFNEFWIRDALVLLPSYLSINQIQFSKHIISKISNMINDKGLPNVEFSDLYPMDTPALFLIDLYEVFTRDFDKDLILNNKDKIDKILNLLNKRLENGLIHDNGFETWMDSINREFSIEIQAMWASALDKLKILSDVLNLGYNSIEDIKNELIKNINKYKRESYFSDQLNRDINSANQIFIPYFIETDDESYKIIINNIKQNLLMENGILSVSKDDKTFDFNGYHNGAIWPFLTAICAGISYDRDIELSKKCLSILQNNLELQCSSRINEIIRPDGKPEGCPSQAWSIGLIPHIIDRFILGIKIDLRSREVRIRKRNLPNNFSRTLITLNKTLNIGMKDGKFYSNLYNTESKDEYIVKL